MRCYNSLYVSKKAKKNRYHIIKSLRDRTLRLNTYVITTPSSNSSLLDILSSSEYVSKYYDEVTVIGIAEGKQDALELVRRIVDDMYHKTGDFNIYAFCDLDNN